MPLFAVIFVFYRRAGKPRPILITPRLCRSRCQFAQQMSSEAVKLSAVRLLPLTNEAARLSVVHERVGRGFRPTCEVKTGTFGPRTTSCRPVISRSQLIVTKKTDHTLFMYSPFCYEILILMTLALRPS